MHQFFFKYIILNRQITSKSILKYPLFKFILHLGYWNIKILKLKMTNRTFFRGEVRYHNPFNFISEINASHFRNYKG
jgi:hypothetical protein